MKKIVLISVFIFLSISLIIAGDIRVLALKGPTAMGLAGLKERAEEGPINGNNYIFTLEATPDAAVASLVRGTVDIAAIPANLASVLYNRTNGGIVTLGINTLGVLYIVENGESVKTISDLKGKTIYASGRGATPEYTLLYLLSQAGLEVGKDVFIEWKSEHAECVAAISADRTALAMIPQPFATAATASRPEIRTALDLNDLWREATGLELLTGVTVVRKDFLLSNKDAVDSFLKDYLDSVIYVNENEGAPLSIERWGIIDSETARLALPYCNITLITGDDLESSLSFYLEKLFELDEEIIGGAIPGNDFYYKK